VVDVELKWHKIDWTPNDAWRKDIVPKLKACSLTVIDLSRGVYVIRLNGEYCIQYPKGRSPTLYVGEGRFIQRFKRHRAWITELQDLVRDFSFQIRIAVPRVKNSLQAYRDCEAALLDRFGVKFGSTPLWNRQFETRLFGNYKYKNVQMDEAICRGKGTKYKWELKPLRASRFYDVYHQGHLL
jgi:hypothetical protein